MRERGVGRVLIVDDESGVRATLEEYLTAVGYAVVGAPDVPTALAILPQGFDVVLCDLHLPGVDGLAFLQEVRRVDPALGVFVITGYPSLETIIDAKRQGAVGYLRKPLPLAEVAARLREFLDERAP
jgi:two-component system response regulator AtoC